MKAAAITMVGALLAAVTITALVIHAVRALSGLPF